MGKTTFLELQNHNLHNKIEQLNTIIRRQRQQLTCVQDALEKRNNEIRKLKSPNNTRVEYWCINDDFKPQWVQDLIDRKLLIHKPTHITDCYEFYQTTMSTSPVYLYDGDGLCYYDNSIGVIFNFYYKSFQEIKGSVPMIKYYCDICGKEVFNINDLYEVRIYKKEYEYHGDVIHKDICKECADEINNTTKRRNKD